MATSTLIQYLEGTAADGTALDGTQMHRRQVETFLSGAAIVAGNVVMFDVSKTHALRSLYVVAAGVVATGNPLAIGVALNTVTGAGEKVQTIISGYAEDVKCAAGVAAGHPLSAAQAAIGEVDTRVAADTAQAFGVALEAVAGASVDMIVFKQF